ncbi:F-box protein At3g08750-like [Typha angustifolia]|uniref:F-box protein At3g08750-like n=1 Tax=Typha angustifolia TaxID=59011 RepID=UPI003C30719E
MVGPVERPSQEEEEEEETPPSRWSDRIPEHLLTDEILQRLPVKSIMRFKAVCVAWHDILSDPHFVYSHLLHSKKNVRTLISLITPVDEPVMMFTFTFHESRFEATFFFKKLLPWCEEILTHPLHCNGLLLISTSAEMSVRNPATGESLTLPNGSTDDLPFSSAEHVGFCFDSRACSYKVVRHFYRMDLDDENDQDEEPTYTFGLEVLTLGSDAWKPVTEPPPYQIETHYAPASVGGNVYWLAKEWDLVICFNVEEEEFSVIDSPPVPKPRWVKLFESEERLCFFCFSDVDDTAEIWMMSEDGRAPLWTQILSANLKSFIENLEDPTSAIIPVKTSNGKFLFLAGINFCYYDPRNKSFQLFKIDTSEFTRVKVGMSTYVESLVNIRS